jgi:hypothetical protein
MNEKVYQQTEVFLRQLAGFISGIAEEPDRVDSNPEGLESDIAGLAAAAGAFEGRRLKGWGLMTDEFQEVIQRYGACFGIDLTCPERLGLPFAGKRLKIDSKDDNLGQWKLWLAYFSSLLSVYGMEEVVVTPDTGNESENMFIVRECRADDGKSLLRMTDQAKVREYVHSMNNHLGGIISFASVIEGVPKDRERAKMILSSAQVITDLVKKTFPKSNGN